MKEYRFQSKSSNKILWGECDSDFFFTDLKNYLENEKNYFEELVFDFEGIKSVDYAFINEVFVKILTNSNILYNNSVIFKNVENESIVYYLNQSFRKNNIVAYIREKESIKSIGCESCEI